MKIYRTAVTEGCEYMRCEDRDRPALSVAVNGIEKMETWRPIPVRVIRVNEKGNTLKATDSCLVNMQPSAIALKRKAVDKLADLLKRHGEVLPLEAINEEVGLFNVTQIIDGLDQKKAKIWRSDEGRILDVRRYAIRSNVIDNVSIFKIPDLSICPVLFTSAAVEVWKRAQIEGLDFVEAGETV